MRLADRDVEAAKTSERTTLATLFASAHRLRDSAICRSQHPPRFVREGARTMARHLGMADRLMQELAPAMGLWQAYLPAALVRDTAMFTEARSRFPCSYEVLRSAFAEMESRRQVVIAMFHMPAMPLVGALLAAACAETTSGQRHALLAPGNIAWLQTQSARWTFDAWETISADQSGLRRLISGLRLGTITRLLILVDGPHAAGSPGTRPLANISPTLAFKTSLLARILAMGIPIRPLTHMWESNALVLNWHPFLNDTRLSDGICAEEQAISNVASLIEDLLRRHPEQWLNWYAAGLRI
jgi:lauroyl/myristoyl acyltransferase